MLRSRQAKLLTNAAIVVAFVSFVSLNGTPALRHDWMWPADRSGFLNVFTASFSGWSTDGIGSPSPRMLQYLINIPIVIVGLAAGPMVSLALFAAGIAAVVTYGARRMCYALEAPGAAVRIAAMLLALFNPWTYDHIVAGHMAMVLSYGASLVLLSFALQKQRANRFEELEAVCFVALAMPQLQLFLVDSILVTLMSIRRGMRLPLVSYVLALIPTAIGVLSSVPDLAATPFTQDWERAQGVPLRAAWALAGYFAGYDRELPRWGLHVFEMALLIAAGAAVVLRRNAALAICAAAGVILLLVSGPQGPGAAVFSRIFALVPPVRAFRELHDLLAFVLCGYVTLAALSGRDRRVSVPLAGLALLYAVSWAAAPPYRWWVDGRTVDSINLANVPAASRFALFPAFQPLAYHNRGSGVDPQAITARGIRSPINEIVPLYPTSIALAKYRRNNDTTLLRSLSVSSIFERPDFKSVATNFAPGTRRSYKNRTIALTEFVPLLSICRRTGLFSAQAEIGDCNRFYFDTEPDANASAPLSNVETPDPRRDWIDVRLVFPRYPDLGEPFGGVYTESRSAIFRPSKRALLARVGGTLFAGERAILTSKPYLSWIILPSTRADLRCAGQCLIALEADAAPSASIPARGERQAFKKQSLRQIAPWWSAADLDSGGVIRYNVRYEPQWVAFDRCGTVTHFRIDALVNGWTNRTVSCGTMTILYWPAALQLLAAIIATAFFYVMFFWYAAIVSRKIVSN